jgi:hypothetical protein
MPFRPIMAANLSIMSPAGDLSLQNAGCVIFWPRVIWAVERVIRMVYSNVLGHPSTDLRPVGEKVFRQNANAHGG